MAGDKWYRAAGFLDDKRVPDTIRGSYERIEILGDKSQLSKEEDASMFYIPEFSTDVDIQSRLSTLDHVRVLKFADLQNSFRGFTQSQMNKEIDDLSSSLFSGQWCCRPNGPTQFTKPRKLRELFSSQKTAEIDIVDKTSNENIAPKDSIPTAIGLAEATGTSHSNRYNVTQVKLDLGAFSKPLHKLARGPPSTTKNAKPIILVAFGTIAAKDMILNWGLSLKRLGLPFLFGAMDKDTHDLCVKHVSSYAVCL